MGLFDREIIRPDACGPDLDHHDRPLDDCTVCRIRRRPELTDRAASLLGPELMIWRSNFQVKRPAAKAVGDTRNYTNVSWHQDGAYFDL